MEDMHSHRDLPLICHMTLKKLIAFSVPLLCMYTEKIITLILTRMSVRVKGGNVCESALKSTENCIKVPKVIVLPTFHPFPYQRENPTLLIPDLTSTNNFFSP